jgi:hypothetical protein
MPSKKPPSESDSPRAHNGAPSLLDGYLTRAELAKELNRCTRTLERWERLRRGPPLTYIGISPMYRRESVFAWLASLEQRRTQERQKRRRIIAR